MTRLPMVEKGDLACFHSGTRSLSAGSVKLSVGSSLVIPLGVVAGDASYSNCQFKDTNGLPHPCIKTAVTSPGSSKLTVGGAPVLLDGDTVTTSNDLQTVFTATVDPAQSKLTAS